jgi:hypothetical protein
MERKLVSIMLTTPGCIYFKEDLPHGAALVTTPLLSLLVLQRFTIGQLVENEMEIGASAVIQTNR